MIECWYHDFRETRAFQIPTQPKHNFPPFLDLNSDVCEAIKKYAYENLATMSIEMMSQYIHSTILPQLVKA